VPIHSNVSGQYDHAGKIIWHLHLSWLTGPMIDYALNGPLPLIMTLRRNNVWRFLPDDDLRSIFFDKPTIYS